MRSLAAVHLSSQWRRRTVVPRGLRYSGVWRAERASCFQVNLYQRWPGAMDSANKSISPSAFFWKIMSESRFVSYKWLQCFKRKMKNHLVCTRNICHLDLSYRTNIMPFTTMNQNGWFCSVNYFWKIMQIFADAICLAIFFFAGEKKKISGEK